MEPSYRQALAHAWSLVWHHKIMWVLGLLSVFIGELGLSNFLGQIWAKFLSPTDSWWPSSWGRFNITDNWDLFWFVWVFIILAAVAVFVLVAAVCAEAALIYAAEHWYRFRTVPSLAKAWHVAAKHFWGVLAVNVVEKFFLSALIVLAVSLFPLIPGGLGGFYASILLLASSVFAAFLFVLTSIYALGYIVSDDLPVVEAFGRGWDLLKRHMLVSLELTALLLLCNVLVAWVISVGSVLVVIPSFFASLLGGATGVTPLITFAVGLYVLLFVIFIALLGAIFNAFTTSAWIYLFMKLRHEGLTSRLLHFAGKIFRR